MKRLTASLIAIAIALAAWLGLAGAHFMYNLERREPPIGAGIDVSDPHTPRLARTVYLVIIDGLGRDRSHLPFLDELRRVGSDVGATSMYPTWSRPNYVSILTGVPPPASGIRTNYHPMSLPLDSVMARARAGGLRVGWVSDYPVIPPLFLGPGVVDLDEVEFGDDHLVPPPGYAWPFDEVRRRPTPAQVAAAVPSGDLVLIVLGDVDRAGHLYGAASPHYHEAALQVDDALGAALAGVDRSQDAILVMADHGHVDSGGHGGLEPEVVHVPLIVAGRGFKTGQVDARLIDVAPTVAALLGVPAPRQALGRTLTGILTLDADQAQRRETADRERVMALEQVIADDEARDADEVGTRRLWRLPLLLVGLGVVVAVGRGLAGRKLLELDGRFVPVAAVALVVTTIAFVAMVRGYMSPSHVPSKTELIPRVITTAVAGVVTQLGVALATLRGRLARANGVAWVGLTLAVLPCAVLLALAPQADVPSPAMIVTIPATELVGAATCIALAVMLIAQLALSRRAR